MRVGLYIYCLFLICVVSVLLKTLRIVENTFVCLLFYSRFTNSKNNEFGHSSYSRKYHTGISMCSPGRKSDRCIVFMVQRQFYNINRNAV
jgi:hypothetical protein